MYCLKMDQSLTVEISQNGPHWLCHTGRGQQVMKRKQTSVFEWLWLEGFEHLHEYVKSEGHALVPVKYITGKGYCLGAWVEEQRRKYKQGTLPKNQQQKLERLKNWVWNIKEAKWNEGFKCLCQYVKREGNARAPRRYIQKNGYKLGLWVMSQRQQYQQGRLPKRRQKALEQLPGWVWNAQKYRVRHTTKSWLKSLERLREYVQREGNAAVRQSYVTENGYKLGTWVSNQRYQHKKGELSRDQEKTLEQLPGWVWSVQGDFGESVGEVWLKALVRLGEYVERQGHACVPAHYKTHDGFLLGRWVRDQRYEHKKGRLSKDKKEILEQLPGWIWNTQRGMKESWLKSLNRLRGYVEQEGNAVVSYSYVTENGYKLGTWVRDQRYEHKKGRLSREQEAALEELAGWVWSVRQRKQ